jgi:hypothetical protein
VLSIFTIPKPFVGHIGIIQRNSIRSWLALRPSCEITLFGDEEGTADSASQLGVRHVPDLRCSEYGTPLLNDAFRQVEKAAGFRHLCYVNADIILPAALTQSVKQVPFPAFLMTGQRMYVDVDTEFDFADPERARAIEAKLTAEGTLRFSTGTDYFVFTKGALGDLPPFAVGRPGWDNWMVFRARQLHLQVVDATPALLAFHQNHDYAHVPRATGELWEGPEADRNRELVDPLTLEFTKNSATWRLTGAGLVRHRWWNRGLGTVLTEIAAFHAWARPVLPLMQWLRRTKALLRGRARR